MVDNRNIPMTLAVTSPALSVARKLVAEADRLNTLPKVFGPRYMLVAESSVYRFAGRLTKYDGGEWSFYILDNGGFYMAPKQTESFDVFAPNGRGSSMSADALGITSCLYAIGWLANRYEQDSHIELYYALLAYAKGHPEGEAIMQAID